LLKRKKHLILFNCKTISSGDATSIIVISPRRFAGNLLRNMARAEETPSGRGKVKIYPQLQKKLYLF